MESYTEIPMERELKRVINLRKIDKLRKIPLVKWNKSEILDFIEHYILYFNNFKNSDHLLNIDEFLNFGMYKKVYNLEIEDLKKDD